MRTGQRDRKLNNAGLSLVELVVVIAIMAVMVGGSFSIVVAINNARTKSCAQSIYSDLSRVKANTLAKQKGSSGNEYYFKLKRGANGEIIAEERVEESAVIEKVIGVKELGVSYATATGSGTSLSTTDNAKCTFDRSSGSVKTSNFETITVAGARAEYVITLYPATGKVKMERTK